MLVKDLATDEAGNVYLTGRYSGDIDFDPGPGTVLLPNVPNVSNYFTVKFGVNGAFVWARANAGRSKFAVENSEHISQLISKAVSTEPGSLRVR